MNTPNIMYEEAPFDPGAPVADVPAARALRFDERALSLFERYLQAVITRRLMILGILLVSLSAGVIAYLMTTPQYRATSRVEITRAQPKVTNVEGLEMEERGRDVQFYETQYRVLQARSLAERVARVLGLQNDDNFFKAFGGGKAKGDSSAAPAAKAPDNQANRLRSATSILLNGIGMQPVGNSNLV